MQQPPRLAPSMIAQVAILIPPLRLPRLWIPDTNDSAVSRPDQARASCIGQGVKLTDTHWISTFTLWPLLSLSMEAAKVEIGTTEISEMRMHENVNFQDPVHVRVQFALLPSCIFARRQENEDLRHVQKKKKNQVCIGSFCIANTSELMCQVPR